VGPDGYGYGPETISYRISGSLASLTHTVGHQNDQVLGASAPALALEPPDEFMIHEAHSTGHLLFQDFARQ
jgi:hypothetical protein